MRVQNPNIDLRSKTTSLTSAQLKALLTTPVALVPAPGAGRIVAVFGVAFIYAFGTVRYSSGSADSLNLKYATTGDLIYLYGGTVMVSATQSTFFNTSIVPINAANILPGDDNKAVMLSNGFNFNAGPIVTTTLGAGGALYAANDTGILVNGAGDATYKVLTVDGGGAVLTYQITAAGTDYVVENGSPTATGGAQPGLGAGLTLNITAVQTGDGTLKVVTYYQIIPVP